LGVNSYQISENPQSETCPHSSPAPSCGREESRGGAIPYPQKNSLPRRVHFNRLDSARNSFELHSIHTAIERGGDLLTPLFNCE